MARICALLGFIASTRHRSDAAQTDPQIGGTDGRVHAVMGIVGQHIDIGYIPSVTVFFDLRVPPAVFGHDHPGIDSVVELGPFPGAAAR